VAECAAALSVSADWLLGLSDHPARPGAMLDTGLTVTAASRSSVDQQIDSWIAEAAGYKICHVPATLPDILKTKEILAWEYGSQTGRTTRQAIRAVDDQRDRFASQKSDYEFALPVHVLESFARGEGYFRGLSPSLRRAQIDRMSELYDTYYPALRICLFNAPRVYSAPVTVYGPLLAVIYLGQHYLVFREAARVQTLKRHFDNLVREAVVTEREIPGKLADLRRDISDR